MLLLHLNKKKLKKPNLLNFILEEIITGQNVTAIIRNKYSISIKVR
jgi:hypothetical protein